MPTSSLNLTAFDMYSPSATLKPNLFEPYLGSCTVHRQRALNCTTVGTVTQVDVSWPCSFLICSFIRTPTRFALYASRDVTSAIHWLVQPCLLDIGERTCFWEPIEFGPSWIAGWDCTGFWGAGDWEATRWPANVELRGAWVDGAEEKEMYNKLRLVGNF